MALIATLAFLTGLYFWSLGAWPVIGFLGLDILAVWFAFKLSYGAGRAFEEVEVSRTALVIRKVNPRGRAQEIRFNPHWVKLEVEEIEDEGVARISVRVRGDRVRVGAFLNPADRRSFARAFGAALAEARR
jgi:uncharacterized membrane protein